MQYTFVILEVVDNLEISTHVTSNIPWGTISQSSISICPGSVLMKNGLYLLKMKLKIFDDFYLF